MQGEEMMEIEILVGVEEGMQLFFCGKGNVGVKGGLVGDLLINIEEKLYDYLQWDGMNLVYELYFNFVDVVLGILVEVFIIDGWVKIKVLVGIQFGKIFCLKGKGLFSVQFYGKGD